MNSQFILFEGMAAMGVGWVLPHGSMQSVHVAICLMEYWLGSLRCLHLNTPIRIAAHSITGTADMLLPKWLTKMSELLFLIIVNCYLISKEELLNILKFKLINYISFTKLPIRNPFSSMHSYIFPHQASNRFQQPMMQSIREMVS